MKTLDPWNYYKPEYEFIKDPNMPRWATDVYDPLNFGMQENKRADDQEKFDFAKERAQREDFEKQEAKNREHLERLNEARRKAMAQEMAGGDLDSYNQALATIYLAEGEIDKWQQMATQQRDRQEKQVRDERAQQKAELSQMIQQQNLAYSRLRQQKLQQDMAGGGTGDPYEDLKNNMRQGGQGGTAESSPGWLGSIKNWFGPADEQADAQTRGSMGIAAPPHGAVPIRIIR